MPESQLRLARGAYTWVITKKALVVLVSLKLLFSYVSLLGKSIRMQLSSLNQDRHEGLKNRRESEM